MEILATNLLSLWFNWLWPILLFVIGLGLVVFVHELGHFLVAKAVGIKIERFAFGFGRRLCGIQRGETDYCINLIPLGGYVKMLGQEDVKQVEETNDPRSFNSKSVGARFAVIAAGVVMNILLAAVLFILVAMVGKKYLAPVVGSVAPGFPASEVVVDWQGCGGCGKIATSASCPTSSPASAPVLAAASAPSSAPASAPVMVAATSNPACPEKGLKPGDKILAIEASNPVLNLISKPVTRFPDLFMVAALAEPEGQFTFTLERQVDGRTCTGLARMGVKRALDGSQLIFGIGSAFDTVFGSDSSFKTCSPFKDGDRLLAIDGQKIAHQWEISQVDQKLSGREVNVTIDRRGKTMDVPVMPWLALKDDVIWLSDGTLVRGWLGQEKDDTVTLDLADGQEREVKQDQVVGGSSQEHLDILGMIPRLQVLVVEDDSPADKAGLQPGDIVVGYGDQSAPTRSAFLKINAKYQGKGTHISVRRGKETLKLWIVPPDRRRIGVTEGPDLSHLVVAGVREGSPAARAGIESEAVIRKVNDQAVENWNQVYDALKQSAGRDVSITYRIGDRESTANLGTLDKNAFDAALYDFSLFGSDTFFRPLEVKLTEKNPLKALAWGATETWKMTLSTYISLRRVAQGTVSHKSLSGPVGIGSIAIQVGRKSVIDFIYFIAFISVSLAVINFLPIPVLDGGHALFLLIEKIMGRPLPQRVLYIAQVAGLALIGVVFLALTWQDIARIVGKLW
ncbi:MAG: site-2 protease family protein [Phycisphaerae bacterium]|jgi:regulator of sigma E protease